MGCCMSKRSVELTESKGKAATVYTSSVALKIKDTDATGAVLGFDNVAIHALTKPLVTKSQLFNLQNCVVQTAYCVLPGLDPRGTEHKDCQDSLFISLAKGYFLAALFDGHGAYGKDVVDFCTAHMKRQYEAEIDELIVSPKQRSPKEALVKLVEDCDRRTIEVSGVDVSLSGSTAVLLLITPTQIYSACLGDSRGVLGCVPGPNAAPRNEKEPKQSPFNRPINPGRDLVPIAMTLDQKPNLEQEMSRIRAAGGIVQKVTDPSGNKVGPYRVWKSGTTHPGLAMSRSIGDCLAKSVGVIGTPVVQQFTMDFERDLFAVIASDGVW